MSKGEMGSLLSSLNFKHIASGRGFKGGRPMLSRRSVPVHLPFPSAVRRKGCLRGSSPVATPSRGRSAAYQSWKGDMDRKGSWAEAKPISQQANTSELDRSTLSRANGPAVQGPQRRPRAQALEGSVGSIDLGGVVTASAGCGVECPGSGTKPEVKPASNSVGNELAAGWL